MYVHTVHACEHVSVMHNACVHILYAYKIKFKIQFFYYDKCSVLFDLQMKKTNLAISKIYKKYARTKLGI